MLCLKLFCHFGKNKQIREQFQTKKVSRNLSNLFLSQFCAQLIMKEHSVTEHDSDEFAELRLQTMNDTISKYSDKNVIIILIFFQKFQNQMPIYQCVSKN